MKNLNDSQEKLEIEYPCQWLYKVIGTDATLTTDAIKECCGELEPKISYSNASSSGKYHSFNATVTVPDEKTRLAIFDALKLHPSLKMVL